MPKERPQLILELSEERCNHVMHFGPKPLMVVASLNRAAKDALVMRGQHVPQDSSVCVSGACAMKALSMLAPLQALVQG